MWSHVATLKKMENGTSDLDKVQDDIKEIMEDPDMVKKVLGEDAHLYM